MTTTPPNCGHIAGLAEHHPAEGWAVMPSGKRRAEVCQRHGKEIAVHFNKAKTPQQRRWSFEPYGATLF